MNSKKITLILCPVFAALSLLFIVLSVINFTKKPDEQTQLQTNAAEFVMNGEVVFDAPAKALEAVVSNDMKAQADYPDGILEELKQAYSINNDLVGWLSIPGTEIDTAIVQGADNNYYLKKDFYTGKCAS